MFIPIGSKSRTPGETQMAVDATYPDYIRKIVKAWGWHEPYSNKLFLIRPVGNDRYHVRFIVGTVTTTDEREMTRHRAMIFARKFGIVLDDSFFLKINTQVAACR